ncbi:hypothetical protein N431DRAFT_329185 [Stipitochalara longipes BDJ]|nr:hypothetical protein N431DRAFT_329185 [Stipitochalara longipes BDJ]
MELSKSSTNSTGHHISLTVLVGWANQPNTRGTMDIIWSCFFAIFSCTWSIIHINLPEPNEGFWSIFSRKARWSLWAVYAPELLTTLAASQWQSARRSREAMRCIGVQHWDTVHGFFANAGGFVLHTRDAPPFPINSKSIFYLVSKGYIQAPSVTSKEIWDRSKRDKFAKGVAVIQGTYLVAEIIARALQSLAISCLELTTLAFLVCTAATYYFWMEKPLDAEVPIHIHMDHSMASVLISAGTVAEKPFVNTPMDFVEQPGWNAWKRHAIFTNFGGLRGRPIQRVPNDFVEPPITMKLALLLWFISVLHLSLGVCGWKFTFPTIFEKYLWRCTTLSLLVLVTFGGLTNVLTVKPGLDYTITTLGIWQTVPKKNTLWRRWALNMPAIVASGLYFLGKTIILIEALVSLRLMPESVYHAVEWTQFFLEWS